MFVLKLRAKKNMFSVASDPLLLTINFSGLQRAPAPLEPGERLLRPGRLRRHEPRHGHRALRQGRPPQLDHLRHAEHLKHLEDTAAAQGE